MKILTIGTFDLLHAGHMELFRYGNMLGKLIVGVNSDEFVEQYKGEPPAQCYEDRKNNIIRFASSSVYKNDSSGKELIDRIKPHVILIGMDWHERDYLAQIGIETQYLDDNRIILIYAPRTTGVSTTAIKEGHGTA